MCIIYEFILQSIVEIAKQYKYNTQILSEIS